MPPRSRGGGAARPAVTTTGTRGLSLLLRVPSSPCSREPWVLRCSPDSPPPEEEEEHLVRNEGRNEAWEALKAVIADMFRPLLRNLADIRALRTVYDLEDYHVGMLFGTFLACVGCYQLWKTAPSVFIDVVLAYAFYKLSVVSSEVTRYVSESSTYELTENHASEINAAILTSQSHEEDPKLPALLKMLIWTQKQLNEKAVYPQINNFSTAALEDPAISGIALLLRC